MKAMFQITHFSPKGSNDLAKEEATYMLFVDILYDCSEGIDYNYGVPV